MLNSCLRLTSLEILCSTSRLALPQQLWDLISSLSSLQRLHMECVEAEEWLFEPESTSELADFFFDESEGETSSADGGLSAPASMPLRPIAAALPNLEYLHLETRNCKLEPEHILQLPKSLTHFHLLGNDNFTTKCLPYFYDCPNMRSIRVKVAPKEVISGVLAPSITSVTFYGGARISIPASFWSASKLLEFIGDATPDTLLQLPPSIEVIKFSNIWHSEGWNVREIATFLNECNLPNIKQLCFPSAYNVDPHSKRWPEFPSKLEHLTLTGYSYDVSSENLADPPFTLPSTLKSLEAENFKGPTALFKAITELGSLTRLVFHLRHQFPKDSSFFANLPETLTHLEFKESWQSKNNANLEPVFLNPILAKLPRNLQTLILCNKQFYMTSIASRDLPRMLKTLSIAFILEAAGNLHEHILGLPRYISDLTLVHARILNRAGSSNSWPGPKPFSNAAFLKGDAERTAWTIAMVKSLPSMFLTSLSILNAVNTHWVRDSMEHLSSTPITRLAFSHGTLTMSLPFLETSSPSPTNHTRL